MKIKLHAGSSQEKIVYAGNGGYEIWIKEKPIDNKANLALERFLRKYFKKKFKVVSGFKSRDKVVEEV